MPFINKQTRIQPGADVETVLKCCGSTALYPDMGAIIREIRLAQNMTEVDLIRVSGLPQSQVGKLREGKWLHEGLLDDKHQTYLTALGLNEEQIRLLRHEGSKRVTQKLQAEIGSERYTKGFQHRRFSGDIPLDFIKKLDAVMEYWDIDNARLQQEAGIDLTELRKNIQKADAKLTFLPDVPEYILAGQVDKVISAIGRITQDSNFDYTQFCSLAESALKEQADGGRFTRYLYKNEASDRSGRE